MEPAPVTERAVSSAAKNGRVPVFLASQASRPRVILARIVAPIFHLACDDARHDEPDAEAARGAGTA
jgi:hypothetical protein